MRFLTDIKRVGPLGGAVVVVLLGAWLVGTSVGLIPIGYWDRSGKSEPTGGIVISSGQSGLSLGMERSFFFEGQEVYIDYQVTIRTGRMRLYLRKGAPGSPKVFETTIDKSGAGRFKVRIPSTGFYRLVRFDGPGFGTSSSNNKAVYDLDYTMSWGVV